MSASSSKKLVADKYALDYYRRPLATRLWKRRWNWLALLIALLMIASLYLALQDEAFQAGPISPAHVAAGATCKDCHDQTWQPALRLAMANSDIHSVSDATCRKCHQVANHHQMLGTAGHACATCHQEHRGGQMLTHILDSQCVACHKNLTELPQTMNDFYATLEKFSPGSAEHPEFAIWRDGPPPGKAHGVWSVARLENSSTGPWLDAGGVKFNHQVHLAAEGLLDADRKPVKLECAACHKEDAGGEFMAPINYQQHCATCHPLRLSGRFELLGDLPHREPETVRAVIRERLSQQTITAENEAKPEQVLPRIPLLPKPAQLTLDQTRKVDQLLVQAEHAVLGLEAKGMCRKCHHIAVGTAGWEVLRHPPGMPLATADASESPIIPHQWFQHGRFDHASHRAVDCDLCHQAASSDRTSDILLPSISTCRNCHGAAVTTMAEGVGDSCVMCHRFHSGGGAANHAPVAIPKGPRNSQ